MEKNHVDILLKEYKKIRKSEELNRNMFVYILKLFPALLVCIADGKLDEEEWEGIYKLSVGLAEEYKSLIPKEIDRDIIAREFMTELRFLTENMNKWEKKFINALNNHLATHTEDKEFISETMYLFANSADGISREEQKAIDLLEERLLLKF